MTATTAETTSSESSNFSSTMGPTQNGSKKWNHPDRASPSTLSPLAETVATTASLPTNGGSVGDIVLNHGGTSNNNGTSYSPTPFYRPDESITSSLLFDANNEAFSAANSDTFSFDETSILQDQGSCTVSILSAEEAGSILERHIAEHPIESAQDCSLYCRTLAQLWKRRRLEASCRVATSQQTPQEQSRGDKGVAYHGGDIHNCNCNCKTSSIL